MISVEEALARIFDLVTPVEHDDIPLRYAAGRVLRAPVAARRDQPPFVASAMDGYAIAGQACPGQKFNIIGEAAAGTHFPGTVSAGEAVRIFTGAPIPEGADRVIIQEDVERNESSILVTGTPEASTYVRPAGADFKAGHSLDAPRRLGPADIALCAAMNVPVLQVTRRPEVAIIATGDELAPVGATAGPDQITASNALGLAALVRGAGARARILPIARDTEDSLNATFDRAQTADLIVTIGGASVGDHDLVAKVALTRGAELAVHRIAMRPGKPVMAGRMGETVLLGLPGNPVSSMVCGYVFMLPTLNAMMGLVSEPAARRNVKLAQDLPANGPREHYMRARFESGKVSAFPRQDSALLTVLHSANALIVRPRNAPAAPAGATVQIIDI